MDEGISKRGLAFRIHPTLRYVVGVADRKDRCSLRANGEVANLEGAALSLG